MDNSIAPITFCTILLVTMLLPSPSAYGASTAQVIDVQNDEVDVTLFRGAANNSYFPVYFKALPEKGAEKVSVETLYVNLRPERDVTLHVEI